MAKNRGRGRNGGRNNSRNGGGGGGKTPSARQRLKDGLGSPMLHIKLGDGETSAERVIPVPTNSGIWRGMRPGSGAFVQDTSGLTKRPASLRKPIASKILDVEKDNNTDKDK